MRSIPLVLASLSFVVALPHPAAGQATRDTMVVHIAGGSIDAAFQSLTASASAADFVRDLPTSNAAQYQLVALRRMETGPAEIHAAWSDVVIVRSGTAVLRTGRVLAEQGVRAEGELVGASIPDGRDQAVGPGDVLIIPAGLAHQWRPSGDVAFTYVVLKVRPGLAPSAR